MTQTLVVKKKRKKATTPVRIDRNRRLRDAMELRKAGISYVDIADRLGYKTPNAAYQAVKRAMSEMVTEPTSELRQMEVQRLTHLLMVLWPRAHGRPAKNGQEAQPPDLAAIDRVLKIQERLAALQGLDAPKRSEHMMGVLVKVEGDTPAEYIDSLRALDAGT